MFDSDHVIKHFGTLRISKAFYSSVSKPKKVTRQIHPACISDLFLYINSYKG